jgi:hypothetical protein
MAGGFASSAGLYDDISFAANNPECVTLVFHLVCKSTGVERPTLKSMVGETNHGIPRKH